ncbi:Bestrophin, RFP-TM, chloride channel-domain-containing protein [Mycena belliarum]|uniref:Bestrophin, RFP-TM, chloride channel-domain-containing protein n=1 Tax=Mycena belliarum TaxID=1033014 RepID=A0AAD6UFB0_9AGAR|nr:Bestrophin, RFP-TM, chloride channel-domain-containing protein [Mycena belliae]
MVATNPLFSGGWSMRKFNATVVNDIWPEVAFFTLIATMVATITEMKIHNLAVNSSLLTVLGTVLGLVISFRTSSAYERYQEGRKMWTNISIASRNIAQIIWIHVPLDRTDKDNKKMTTVESIIEKKSMINLVQGFSVAVKHFLRGENGIYFQDLYPLICLLPRYANTVGPMTSADMLPLWAASEDEEHPLHTARPPPPSRSATVDARTAVNSVIDDDHKSEQSWFRSMTSRRNNGRAASVDPEKALADIQSHRPLKPARDPPEPSVYDYFPFLRIFSIFTRCCRRKNKKRAPRDALGRKIKPSFTESNVPFEICIYLNGYLAYLLRNGWLQPALATGLMNNIAALQDTMSNLDRIGNTPLPFAYQAHLRMSLWLYLLLLPFQVVSVLHYLVIPGTAFASFLLLGFLEIGQEIENPFNYDLNDLDLDGFCLAIQRELHEVTAHTLRDPSHYVFSAWNQPFAPADRRNAHELTDNVGEEYQHADHTDSEPGLASLRRTLLKNWRDVDRITRQG